MPNKIKPVEIKRCGWAKSDDSDYVAYHDEEWGVPTYDDTVLFEFLVLEGAQAGLSWATILQKRKGYQKNFADFDVRKVARFTDKRVARILQDPAIVRNKLKVMSCVTNARQFIKVQEKYGSFSNYVWRFVDHKPIQNRWRTMKQVPAKTTVSDALSKDLKKRGFKFVGSTIIYAYMQAVGMVNDHVTTCFRFSECNNLARQSHLQVE